MSATSRNGSSLPSLVRPVAYSIDLLERRSSGGTPETRSLSTLSARRKRVVCRYDEAVLVADALEPCALADHLTRVAAEK